MSQEKKILEEILTEHKVFCNTVPSPGQTLKYKNLLSILFRRYDTAGGDIGDLIRKTKPVQKTN